MKISLIQVSDRTQSPAFRLFKGILEANGYEVVLIYLNVEKLGSRLTLNDALKQDIGEVVAGSALVCLYVFTFNFNTSVKLTRYLRELDKEIVVAWGGPHALACPQDCAEHADVVGVAEGEEAIVKLAEAIKKDGRQFNRSAVPNIAYKKGPYIQFNDIQPIRDYDAIPFADFSFEKQYYVSSNNRLDVFDFGTAERLEGGKFNYITLISRGCPCRCGFCINSSPGRIKYNRGRSVDNVIEELVAVKERHGERLRLITFYDDDFFALPLDTLTEFAEKYKKHVDVPINFLNATAGSFREDKLLILKEAGIKGVIVGIQTISENGKMSYNNTATRERIQRFVRVMRNHPELEALLHVIIGNPFENEDDLAENVLFIDSLGKGFEISAYQLVIYPGTSLYEAVKTHPSHYHRAYEGYHIPYYFPKPELDFWDLIIKRYPAT